jgi:hypothetical protein
MSNRDCETWFDQCPSHPSRPPLLDDAREASLDAWDNYNAACDRVYADGREHIGEEERAELSLLLDEALEAGMHYLDVYNNLPKDETVINIDREEELCLNNS